jgi:hypothetical protein
MSRSTCSGAGLAAGVDGPGREVGHHLQELGLGRRGVAHHAHVDVSSASNRIKLYESSNHKAGKKKVKR